MATTHLVCDLLTTQPHNALRDRSLCPITSLDAPLVFVSLPCGAPEWRSAIGSWRISDLAPFKESLPCSWALNSQQRMTGRAR